MKAWNGNFSTPTAQKWLEKVEKDLKGKSIDDLSWTWDDTLAFSPAYFVAPNADFKVLSQSRIWAITEPFTLSSPTQTNHDILEALNMGAEHIYVTITRDLSEAEWAALFNKVIFSYIQVTLNFSVNVAALASLDSFLQKSDWSPSQLFIIADQTAEIPANLILCRRVATEIHIRTDDSAMQLAKQMRQSEQILQKSKQPEHLYFNVHLNKSFYHNIAWIQALKILWQNILDAYQLDPNTPIHLTAHIQDNDKLDENTQKINATIQAISAVVCGIHSLLIHPQPGPQKDFERRINRNIQHLLKLESYMDQVLNPTEGAYYFEHLTKELAEHAWAHFKKLD